MNYVIWKLILNLEKAYGLHNVNANPWFEKKNLDHVIQNINYTTPWSSYILTFLCKDIFEIQKLIGGGTRMYGGVGRSSRKIGFTAFH